MQCMALHAGADAAGKIVEHALVFMLNSTADIYKEISDFGILFGRTHRADSLIEYTKKETSSMNRHEQAPRRVYFMWPQSELETSGVKSTVNEMIEASGCVNVCRDSMEHLAVNVERLINWNPDVIIMWCNEKLNPRDIMDNPPFQLIRAVENRQVYELPSQFECDLWTLKFQYVVRLLAAYAYEARFDTLELSGQKAKMMEFLYGKPLMAAGQ